MSVETAPVAPNKASALVELEQVAAQSDMSNDQYEATRAGIEAAHAIVGVEKPEAKPERTNDRPIANAAALLAIHQAAAEGSWDDARIKLAEQQLVEKSATN